MTGSPLLLRGTEGWIADRDPRLRVVGAVLFSLVTVSLVHGPAVLGAFAISAAVALSNGLSFRGLLRRLVALEGFMVILLLTLPFTVPGQTMLAIGPLAASREGLFTALIIMLKASAVVLAVLTLVGSLDPLTFGHALGRLGVPEKLVHLLLLTLRQIHLLHQEFLRLRQAMRARAFVPRSDRHTWKSYGYLVGMLLVRGLARSRRILAAMRCRGFHGRLYLLDSTTWQRTDTWLSLGLLVLIASLPLVDRLL